MESKEVMRIVNEVFIDVLDDDTIQLTPQTASGDIKEWDSLNHIQLIVAIEKRFKIRFTASEIQKWENIGDICEAITKAAGK